MSSLFQSPSKGRKMRMPKYMLLLSGMILCMLIALLSFGSPPPQDRAGGPIAVPAGKSGMNLLIYCCDTCRLPGPCPSTYQQSVMFTNVTLVPGSAADSAWMSQLPDTLTFKIMTKGTGKKITLNWPGVKLEGGKGHVIRGK